jgi:hypothetical protein
VDNQETKDRENTTKKLKRWEESRDKRHGKLYKETKKMGGIKSGKSRETKHGKLNKETKKMK